MWGGGGGTKAAVHVYNMEKTNMAAVGSKKTDGFSLHSSHDHIKIHVCGVLKRNGIMLKNT